MTMTGPEITAKHAPKWLAFAIAALFIVGGLAVGWKSTFQPMFMEIDRETNQNSHQYVEGQKTFMLQKLSAITEMEAEIAGLDPAVDAELIAAKENQIDAFTTEIEERAQLIDESEIPPSIADYLETKETE